MTLVVVLVAGTGRLHSWRKTAQLSACRPSSLLLKRGEDRLRRSILQATLAKLGVGAEISLTALGRVSLWRLVLWLNLLSVFSSELVGLRYHVSFNLSNIVIIIIGRRVLLITPSYGYGASASKSLPGPSHDEASPGSHDGCP
jgi:hypothetical protein